jgi:outer membrane protein OmpA-like peptidoglycan-associated protein
VLSVTKLPELAGVLLLAAFTAACATPAPPIQAARGPELPDPGPSQEYKVKFPDLGRGKARYIALTLGGDVAGDCGSVKAHFEFDSDEPLPQDRAMLESAAECFNQPSIKDHQVLLVGGTDDRGSTAYNQMLGLRRAARVKDILTSAGVTATRIQVVSLGKSGAVGGDERRFSYGYDRRVDVGLLGVVHAPRRGAP